MFYYWGGGGGAVHAFNSAEARIDFPLSADERTKRRLIAGGSKPTIIEKLDREIFPNIACKYAKNNNIDKCGNNIIVFLLNTLSLSTK